MLDGPNAPAPPGAGLEDAPDQRGLSVPNGSGSPVTPDAPITEGLSEILSDAAIEASAYRGIRLTMRYKIGGDEVQCRILQVQGDQIPRDDWPRSRKDAWSAALASVRGLVRLIGERVVRCARGGGHPAGKACSAGARAHGAIAPGVGGD